MSTTHPEPVSTAPKAWWQLSLSQQIMLGLVLGTLLGWWLNGLPAAGKATWVNWLVLIRDTFLHLIKAMIAPLVFASVVQGIAGTGDMKKVGRIGGKALLYFEIVTTAALAVGLLVVNFTKPGVGVKLTASAGALGAAVGFGDRIEGMDTSLVRHIDPLAEKGRMTAPDASARRCAKAIILSSTCMPIPSVDRKLLRLPVGHQKAPGNN